MKSRLKVNDILMLRLRLKDDVVFVRDAGAACFLSVLTVLRSSVGFAFTNARENIRRIVRTAGRFCFMPSASRGRFAHREYRDPCYAMVNEFEVADSNPGRG